jgi:hypothetical protein
VSEMFAALLDKNILKTLDLRGVVAVADPLFNALSRNTSLKQLLLHGGCYWRSNSYQHLANALINNTTLEELALGRDQPVGADVINALALNTGLKKITAEVTRDGAAALLQALQKNTHLEQFCLDTNMITHLSNGEFSNGTIDCRSEKGTENHVGLVGNVVFSGFLQPEHIYNYK